MARPVLTLLLSAAIAGAAFPQTCSPPPDAPVIVRSELGELQKTLKSGPFYRELTRRLGKPQSCQTQANDGNLTITYIFRNHARLVGEANRRLETSEQRMELPGLSEKTAMPLLKAAEKHSYRPSGCGIDWKKSEAEKSETGREIIYRGAACNCQARIEYKNNAIVAVILRNAC